MASDCEKRDTDPMSDIWFGKKLTLRELGGAGRLHEMEDDTFFSSQGTFEAKKLLTKEYTPILDGKGWNYIGLEEKVHELLNDGHYHTSNTQLMAVIGRFITTRSRKDWTFTKRIAVEVASLIQSALATTKGQLIRWYADGILVKDTGKDRVLVELKKIMGSNIAFDIHGSYNTAEDALQKLAKISTSWIGRVMELEPSAGTWKKVLHKLSVQ